MKRKKLIKRRRRQRRREEEDWEHKRYLDGDKMNSLLINAMNTHLCYISLKY